MCPRALSQTQSKSRAMGTTTKDLLQISAWKKGQQSKVEPFSIGEHVSGATRILDKRRQMLEVNWNSSTLSLPRVAYFNSLPYKAWAILFSIYLFCALFAFVIWWYIYTYISKKVQEALDAQKEEFAMKEDAFRRREEALRRKDLDLQESLLKFNRFLQVIQQRLIMIEVAFLVIWMKADGLIHFICYRKMNQNARVPWRERKKKQNKERQRKQR